MKRLREWRSNLREYVLEIWNKPFGYGTQDCMLFVAGAVKAVTGRDYISEYAPEYDSLLSGMKYLKSKGFDDHVQMIAKLFEEVHPSMAHVADIAVLNGDDTGAALGIVQGDMVYVLTKTGIALVSRSYIQRAFRI